MNPQYLNITHASGYIEEKGVKGVNILEEIDVNKTNLSKECDICHYWYF